MPDSVPPTKSFRLRRVLRAVVVVAIAGAIAGQASLAAFSGSSAAPANTVTAGTVGLADDDGGGALLTLSDANSGQAASGCIKVTSTGTLATDVRVYGAGTGTMAAAIDVTITRGTRTGSFPSCTGFTADSTNYVGSGAGVIWTGKLSALPSAWSSGINDPVALAAGASVAYKVTFTVDSAGAAQGTSAGSASFTWEARNQ